MVDSDGGHAGHERLGPLPGYCVLAPPLGPILPCNTPRSCYPSLPPLPSLSPSSLSPPPAPSIVATRRVCQLLQHTVGGIPGRVTSDARPHCDTSAASLSHSATGYILHDYQVYSFHSERLLPVISIASLCMTLCSGEVLRSFPREHTVQVRMECRHHRVFFFFYSYRHGTGKHYLIKASRMKKAKK